VWGGANDVFFQFGALAAGAITPAELQANVGIAAASLVQQVGVLQGAGARNIVVFNLPDIGRSPDGIASGAPAQFSAVSGLFNTTLQGGLDTLGGSHDAREHFRAVQRDPRQSRRLRLHQRDDACVRHDGIAALYERQLVAPDAASTFVFADGVHPTTGAHAVIAEVVASMIEGPAQVGVLAEAPIAVERSTFRAIDARMISGVNAPRGTNRFDFWASYDYGNNDFDGRFVSGDADVNTIAAGGDIKVTPNLLVGAAATFAQNKGDFGGGNGGLQARRNHGHRVRGLRPGPWYAGITLGAGDLDYRDVHRDIRLGSATRRESGETRGWHAMGSVLRRVLVRLCRLAARPVRARLVPGDPRARLLRKRQRQHSAELRRAEARVAGHEPRLAGRRPHRERAAVRARRMGAREQGRPALCVGVVGHARRRLFGADDQARSRLRFVSRRRGHRLGGVTGYLTGSATSGRASGDEYGVTLGVRVPF
jgi:hypothetical protein